jgi:hypothetical protein
VLEDIERDRRWPQVAINQEHFLFGADAPDATFNEAILKHEGERAQVLEQCLHEGLRFLVICVLLDVMFTHFEGPSGKFETIGLRWIISSLSFVSRVAPQETGAR